VAVGAGRGRSDSSIGHVVKGVLEAEGKAGREARFECLVVEVVMLKMQLV
jgi:hypothetical protein